MAVNPEFWSQRRVFITGHTGFKGSWLSLWLQELGAEVLGYALDPPSEPHLYALLKWGPRHHSLRGDIRDLAYLKTVMQQFQPEIVIHLAAQALVRESYRQPVDTFATNVMGTVHLLEAARQTPSIRVLLNVTSDKCYHNPEEPVALDETRPMGGKDPYSSSKACAELVAQAYQHSFFKQESLLALASARAGNVIGGGDWAPDRLLPDLARALQADQILTLRNPEAVRPWQHVLDLLCGYLQLLEYLWEYPQRGGEGWNFGPPAEQIRPVGQVVRQFLEHSSRSLQLRVEPCPSMPEAHWLMLDSQKSRRILGWKTRLDLDTALAWTARWYDAHARSASMHAFSLQQLQAYCLLN